MKTNLFQYVPGNSVIHRMNPVTKIFLTIVICVAAFISGNLFYLAGLLAVDLLIGIVAGVAGKTWTIFKGLLKIAIFLFVLQILLVRGGTPVFWIITDQGLLTAARVVIRLVVICMPLALVLAVTRVTDLTISLPCPAAEHLHAQARRADPDPSLRILADRRAVIRRREPRQRPHVFPFRLRVGIFHTEDAARLRRGPQVARARQTHVRQEFRRFDENGRADRFRLISRQNGTCRKKTDCRKYKERQRRRTKHPEERFSVVEVHHGFSPFIVLLIKGRRMPFRRVLISNFN